MVFWTEVTRINARERPERKVSERGKTEDRNGTNEDEKGDGVALGKLSGVGQREWSRRRRRRRTGDERRR